MTDTPDLRHVVSRLSDLTTMAQGPRAPGLLGELRQELSALKWRLAPGPGDVPLPIVLLFGSSGAGKSTLFNQLLGGRLSRTSSIERPTTVGAIAAIHVSKSSMLATSEIFSTMKARRASAGAPAAGRSGEITWVEHEDSHFSDSLLVDCPDFDTLDAANRTLCDQLLAWADLVYFVTSPDRYGDGSADTYLKKLRAASVPVICVLNQLTEAGRATAISHCTTRMRSILGESAGTVLPVLRRRPESPGVSIDITSLRHVLREADLGEQLRRRLHTAEKKAVQVDKELADFETQRIRLQKRMAEAGAADVSWQPDDFLKGLARFEETHKFWLKYSPRGVWKSLVAAIKRPATLVEPAPNLPEQPAVDVIRKHVVQQARFYLESTDVAVREFLKSDPIGRDILKSSGTNVAPVNVTEIEVSFAGFIQEIEGFALKMRTRLSGLDQRRVRGFLAETGLFVFDKVMRIIVLSLSVSALPPLIAEILRAAGAGPFVNEVEREFVTLAERFRSEVRQAANTRSSAYLSALDVISFPKVAIDEWHQCVVRWNQITNGSMK